MSTGHFWLDLLLNTLVGGGLVAITVRAIYRRLTHPKLSVTFDADMPRVKRHRRRFPRPTDIGKTLGGQRVMYDYHVLVRNEGGRVATGCEGAIERIQQRKKDNGSWKEYEAFPLPLPLAWAGRGDASANVPPTNANPPRRLTVFSLAPYHDEDLMPAIAATLEEFGPDPEVFESGHYLVTVGVHPEQGEGDSCTLDVLWPGDPEQLEISLADDS